MDAFESAIALEVAALGKAIPVQDLAIQWDLIRCTARLRRFEREIRQRSYGSAGKSAKLRFVAEVAERVWGRQCSVSDEF